MVPTSDFSGLTSSTWALARAAARLAIELLDRCIAALHKEEVQTDGTRFRALGPNAVAGRLLGVFGHQRLELGLGLFMLYVRRAGPRKDGCELRPRVRGTHIDNAH